MSGLSRTCNTNREPLYKFVFSKDSNAYVRTQLVEEGSNGGRFLRSADALPQSSTYAPESQGGEIPISLSNTVQRTISLVPNNGVISTNSTLVLRSLQDSPRQIGDVDGNVVFARQCTCAAREEAYYCPMGAELCRVQTAYGFDLQCEGEPQGMFGRFMFPFLMFWFVFMMCLCFNSPKGKNAQGYFRKILCCWDEGKYEEELYRELDRMEERATHRRERLERLRERNPNRVYYSTGPSIVHLRRDTDARARSSSTEARPTNTSAGTVINQNGAGNNEEGHDQAANGANGGLDANNAVNHRVVLLKTRKYEKKPQEAISVPETTKEGDDVDELGDNCIICLQPFVEGEKVGDLPCGHVFHATCLKSWIQRKNHCPLCQTEQLAQPHPDDENAQRYIEMSDAQRRENDQGGIELTQVDVADDDEDDARDRNIEFWLDF